MRVAFCDDDKNNCISFDSLSQRYAEKHDVQLTIEIYNNADWFYRDIVLPKRKYDIYFLDIIMPGLSGMDLARMIRDYDKDGIIVFVTISMDYCREAFALEALQYMQKPITYEELERVLERSQRLLGMDNRRFITMRIPGGVRTIDAAHIMYAESYLHVLRFHLCDGSIFDTANSSITMTGLADMLPYPNFYLVSRSYFVNFDFVDYVENEIIAMKDGSIIRMPVKQQSKVKQLFCEYLFGEE